MSVVRSNLCHCEEDVIKLISDEAIPKVARMHSIRSNLDCFGLRPRNDDNEASDKLQQEEIVHGQR